MGSQFVEAAGVRLHVLIEGEHEGEGAESVLVLHGFTGDASSMDSVASALRDGYRVVRIELVGHGQSAAPDDPKAYSMAACVEQVAAVVRELGLGRPSVLGYSMGGRTALAFALAYPDLCERLILVGATAGIADPALREARIEADEALALRLERDGLEAFVDAWMALPLFASQSRLGKTAVAEARAQRMRGSISGWSGSLRGMGAGAQPPLHAKIPGLSCPVLLVVGEEDAKFRAIAAELAGDLQDARTATLKQAGHAAHLEAPEPFAEVVRGFLADSRSSGPQSLSEGES